MRRGTGYISNLDNYDAKKCRKITVPDEFCSRDFKQLPFEFPQGTLIVAVAYSMAVQGHVIYLYNAEWSENDAEVTYEDMGPMCDIGMDPELREELDKLRRE